MGTDQESVQIRVLHINSYWNVWYLDSFTCTFHCQSVVASSKTKPFLAHAKGVLSSV